MRTLLPTPEAPMMKKTSPSRTSKETPSMTSLGPKAFRQVVGAELDHFRKFRNRHPGSAGLLLDDVAFDEIELLGVCLQNGRGCREQFGAQLATCLPGDFSGDRRAARRPGSAAVRWINRRDSPENADQE